MMTKQQSRRLWNYSLILGFCIAVLLTGRFSSFARIADSVRADTLRLHVQANSDSAPDQQLKLKVRDAVLQQAAALFTQQSSKQDAIEKAQQSLAAFEAAAKQVVAAEGSDQAVKVYLTNMYFNTTYYENFTLPAGRYDALRIELGEHAGKNWFCVLYPGLCLPAAGAPAAYPALAEQQLVQAEGYEIRFAALELWGKLTEKDQQMPLA